MARNEEHISAHSEDFFKEINHLDDKVIKGLGSQFSNRVFTLVIASLGLITALAWDDTLKELFHYLFGPTESLNQKLLYSTLVTVVAVVITTLLARGEKRRDKKRFQHDS